MPYAPIQIASSSDQTSSGVSSILATFGGSATGGNRVVVFLQYYYLSGNSGTFSVTDTLGTIYTEVPAAMADDTTDGAAMRAFVGTLTASGTNSVIGHFPSSNFGFADIVAREYSGLMGPVIGGVGNYQASAGTGANAVTSGNYNLTNSGLLPAAVIGGTYFDSDTDGPPAVGTGFGNLGTFWSVAVQPEGGIEDKRVTATGNVAATFTKSGTNTAFTLTSLVAIAESSYVIARGGGASPSIACPF